MLEKGLGGLAKPEPVEQRPATQEHPSNLSWQVVQAKKKTPPLSCNCAAVACVNKRPCMIKMKNPPFGKICCSNHNDPRVVGVQSTEWLSECGELLEVCMLCWGRVSCDNVTISQLGMH